MANVHAPGRLVNSWSCDLQSKKYVDLKKHIDQLIKAYIDQWVGNPKVGTLSAMPSLISVKQSTIIKAVCLGKPQQM